MNQYYESLDESDKLITDFVYTENDVALGKACSNCFHELHNGKKCNAFTKVRTRWDSCDCKESSIEFKIKTKVYENELPSEETNSAPIAETKSLFTRKI